MKDIKEVLKKMKKDQTRFQNIMKQFRSVCPHVKKNGETRLESFEDGGINKGKCSKCGDVVITDNQLLNHDSVTMSVAVVRSILAELRAQVHTKKIRLDSETLDLISKFDAEILADLPDFMAASTNECNKDKSNKKGKNKKHKHGKGKNRNKNQRQRWGHY